MDIGPGAGLSGASGVRPFLPTLLAGALAREDSGIDFDDTSFSFLEKPAFLLIVLVAALGVYAWDRRRQSAGQSTAAGRPGDPRANVAGKRSLPEPSEAALLLIGVVLGALLFAGSLADHGYTSWPGLAGGLACAALGQAAARDLFLRVSGRLDPSARGALPVYFDGAALALCGLSVLAPPVSLLALGFLGWLLAGGRRREGEKYAGLRILR